MNVYCCIITNIYVETLLQVHQSMNIMHHLWVYNNQAAILSKFLNLQDYLSPVIEV